MESTPLQKFVDATGMGCVLAAVATGISLAFLATSPESTTTKLGLRVLASAAILYATFVITRAGAHVWMADEGRAYGNVGVGGVLVAALAVLLYVVLT